MSAMRIQVEVLSGPGGDGTPSRFRLGDRMVEVIELVDRWQGKDADYFRVRGDDGHAYVLKWERSPGDSEPWEIVSYTHKDSQGTRPGGPNDTTPLQ